MIKQVTLKTDITPRTEEAMDKCGKLPSIHAMYGYMVEYAKELERDLRICLNNHDLLRLELEAIKERAKTECEGWNCKERWDFKEYCPNCPYELVLRK